MIIRKFFYIIISVPIGMVGSVLMFAGLLAALAQMYLWAKHGEWYNAFQIMTDFKSLLDFPANHRVAEDILREQMFLRGSSYIFSTYKGIENFMIWYLSLHPILSSTGLFLLLGLISKTLGVDPEDV